MNIALIIAGGSGSRMNLEIPKQFLTVNEKPVIIYTLEAFEHHPQIERIAVVCLEGWETMLLAYAKQFGITKLSHIIAGGHDGQQSIRNGVQELERHYGERDIVLIHDAIRPLVSAEIISDCIMKTEHFGCAVASIPCAEAMLETSDNTVSNTSYPRDRLRRTQTPQGFRLSEICDLHREAEQREVRNSIASCTLMIELGRPVFFSLGSEKNIKLTTTEDLDIFTALLKERYTDRMKGKRHGAGAPDYRERTASDSADRIGNAD